MSVFRVWTKLNNLASNFVNIRAEIEDASVTVTLVIQTPFQMELLTKLLAMKNT